MLEKHSYSNDEMYCIGVPIDFRLTHDLHQRNAGTVEVDERRRGMPVMQRFSSVLLEMQSLNPNSKWHIIVPNDVHKSFPHNRRFVLTDLVALRQIRIEVVLPVEDRL